MKAALLLVFLVASTLAGCDTIHGVSRQANVETLPDLPGVKALVESYPDVKEVKLRQMQGGRPLTLTGIQKATEVFNLSYTDHVNIHGRLQFTRDYSGRVRYSQALCRVNRRPPQEWIDATWPIMKRIEQDLAAEFGLTELRDSVKVYVWEVEDPDREQRSQP